MRPGPSGNISTVGRIQSTQCADRTGTILSILPPWKCSLYVGLRSLHYITLEIFQVAGIIWSRPTKFFNVSRPDE